MNYISQINAFWDWRLSHRISHGETELYFAIMHVINRSGWKSYVSIPNSTLVHLGGFTDASQLAKARLKLVQAGLITYTIGSRSKSGKYNIVKLYRDDPVAGSVSDDFFVPVSDKESDNRFDNKLDNETDNKADNEFDGIYKQNRTKQKTKRNCPPRSPRGTRGEADEIIAGVEDDALRESLRGFSEMRSRLKKPLTARAVMLLLKKLGSMSPDISEQVKIVEQSVMNGWQSVYPLKDKGPANGGSDAGSDNVFLNMAQEICGR